MNTKASTNNKKPSNTQEVVLPLLTSEGAYKLSTSISKEEELQKAADMIRARATNCYFDVILVQLYNIKYIYDELVKKGYVVIYKDVNSLFVSWEKDISK